MGSADFAKELLAKIIKEKEKLQVELTHLHHQQSMKPDSDEILSQLAKTRNALMHLEATINRLSRSDAELRLYLIWLDLQRSVQAAGETREPELEDLLALIQRQLGDQTDLGKDLPFNTIINDSFQINMDFSFDWQGFSGVSDPQSPNDSINQLALAMLAPEAGSSLLDLCSGQGKFLDQAYQQDPEVALFGQEIDPLNVIFSRYRLRKLGSRGHTIACGDAVREPAFLQSGHEQQFARIFSNFPFLMRIDQETLDAVLANWTRFPLELTTRNTADWLFVGTVLNLLAPDGRAAVILCSGPLFKQSDREIRAKLVENGLVEAIVHLPDNILSYTRVSADLLILSRDNASTLMIDASELHTSGRRVNEMSQDDISKVLALYQSRASSPLSRLVSRDEIRANDYNLDPSRYLVYSQIEVIAPVKLDDVAERIFRGVQIPADELDQITQPDPAVKKPYKILSIGDIQNGEVPFDLPLAYVEPSKRFDRYCLEPGDILLPAKGTKLKIAVAEIGEEDRIIATGNIIVIRPKQHKILPHYLKAFLDSQTGQQLLQSIQTGTQIVSISPSQLEEMTVSVLEMEQQEQITQQYRARQAEIRQLRRRLLALEADLEGLYDQKARKGEQL